MSTYIGYPVTNLDELPAGGQPGDVLVVGPGGQPEWGVPAAGGAEVADPTSMVGLTAVNGIATTAMRSDAAPPLNQSITPNWLAAHIFAVNAVANTPALKFTGTPFLGDATTSKPLLLLEPTGTTSTGWSTAGTLLGVNAASGFAGNLIDAQLNGVSKLKVTSAGVFAPDGTAGLPSFAFASNTTSGLYSPGGGLVGLVTGGSELISFYTPSIRILNSTLFGWASGAPSATGFDTGWGRLGPANIRQGNNPSATPLAQTFTIGEASRPGSDSNVAGANGTIQSGLGTGTGAESKLFFQTPLVAGAGSGVQTYGTRMMLDSGGATVTGQMIATGNVGTTGANIRLGAGGYLIPSSDGVISLRNTATTDFSRLQLGGTTASFPAIKRNGAGIDIRNGDDTGYTSLNVGLLGSYSAAYMMALQAVIASGAGAAAGTLTNAPTAGNPTKWIPIYDAGTTRYIPAW
jgi:hypothetical protein